MEERRLTCDHEFVKSISICFLAYVRRIFNANNEGEVKESLKEYEASKKCSTTT